MNFISETKFCVRPKAVMGFLAAVMLVTSACSQSVDAVSIEHHAPAPDAQPFRFYTNVDSQGGSIVPPSSGTFQLRIHAFGGSNLRTTSVSPSFSMVGGIAVD